MTDRLNFGQDYPNTGYTSRELDLITKVKTQMPPPVIKEFLKNDTLILAWIQDVISDINYFPPLTNYEINTIPPFMDTIIVLGSMFYSSLWLKFKWSLQDITTNEGGLTINYGRVEKLSIVEKSFLDLYMQKAKTVKLNQMNALSLGSPRFSSALGTFIRLSLR